MTLRGVIFDMGGTLLHYRAPGTSWEDMEKSGAQGIYARLQAGDIALPPRNAALQLAWEHNLAIWRQLDAYEPADLKLDWMIRELLRKWGVEDAPQTLIAAAAEAYMTAIQQHVVPLEGAAHTLRALQARGLRLGLISNTLWPGVYHRHDLDRYGLTPYLDHLIFSADIEAWKPQPDIFRHGLDALDLQPDEAVYVGDSLYFDVWGAQQAGLRGVWIEQSQRWLPEGIDVTPDATIRHLPDLLDVIETWRNGDDNDA